MVAAMASRALGVTLVLAAAVAVPAALSTGPSQSGDRQGRSADGRLAVPQREHPLPAHERSMAARPLIRWRRSRALGVHTGGRLVRGVRLPAGGRDFATWDPVLHRSPNRPWRRWGTDRLVRLVLRVAQEHRAAHPGAPRVLIGDLSRPGGGDFGIRFGRPGHASHQNGLDVDFYYPRRDRREVAPLGAGEIDSRLAQDLVDRFVRAGAQKVFVGPATRLTGRRGVVQAIPKHDNHLHVRIR
jgi:murein endopeptidase